MVTAAIAVTLTALAARSPESELALYLLFILTLPWSIVIGFFGWPFLLYSDHPLTLVTAFLLAGIVNSVIIHLFRVLLSKVTDRTN